MRLILNKTGKGNLPLPQLHRKAMKACNDEERKIERLGISSLGEMVGWAMPVPWTVFGSTLRITQRRAYRIALHLEGNRWMTME